MTGEHTFTGFGPETFRFFEGLERDNSREYFAAHRGVYETAVRGALASMFDALSAEFGADAKLARQHRDTRFARDKSPYKTNTYGVLRTGSAPDQGFYASISASGLYAGGGYHSLAVDQLERFREAVADERTGTALADALADVERAGLEVPMPELKTAPRGYDRAHPRVELLRRRSLIAGRALAPADGVIGADAALAHVASTWRALAAMNAWLDDHVGPSALPRDRPGRRPG